MDEASSTLQIALHDRVNATLRDFLAEQHEVLDDGAAPLLSEIESVVGAGGKRLRPTFCYWGHIAAGGRDSDAILRASAALELVHTFAIIHDDVLDRSPRRRGRPSTFSVFTQQARGEQSPSDPARFGTAAAILTGDLALVLADRMFSSCGFASDVLRRGTQRFDRLRTRAVAGEYLDLVAAQRREATEEQIRRIGRLKSGGYTVADPLAIGAALGTDGPAVQEALASYGGPLGEAFQLRDDILGVFGDPDLTGKDRDGDLREGKQTVLVARARSAADARQAEILNTHLGSPDLNDHEAELIREVMRATGALDYTTDLIDRLVERARQALSSPALPNEARCALEALTESVAHRDR